MSGLRPLRSLHGTIAESAILQPWYIQRNEKYKLGVVASGASPLTEQRIDSRERTELEIEEKKLRRRIRLRRWVQKQRHNKQRAETMVGEGFIIVSN